jgi:hypothetical protein
MEPVAETTINEDDEERSRVEMRHYPVGGWAGMLRRTRIGVSDVAAMLRRGDVKIRLLQRARQGATSAGKPLL